MRVLLVDDDPDIRKIGALSLVAVGGFQVEVAESGAEAIAKGAEQAPDLILLDIMMPGMDGVATLAELRKLPGLAGTPVVFFTARVQRAEVEELVALGAMGVIGKPFDPMTLASQVRALLAAASGSRRA